MRTFFKLTLISVQMLRALHLSALHFLPILYLTLGGCRNLPTTIPSQSTDAGTLIHVVGWDGPTSADWNFLNALRDGGCVMSMETFDWTDGWRNIFALWRAQHSSVPSAKLAARIRLIGAQHPNQSISLTADSSGCGVALRAIASLPNEIRIRTVVLSSPAVARGYDLHPALQHIDGQLISFNSDRDFIILCLGTTIFATVDLHHASAAGRAGFISPIDLSDASKLRQIAYDPAWDVEFGNNGGHSKAMTPRFAKAIVAPLLR